MTGWLGGRAAGMEVPPRRGRATVLVEQDTASRGAFCWVLKGSFGLGRALLSPDLGLQLRRTFPKKTRYDLPVV